jgi:hypothetical protein
MDLGAVKEQIRATHEGLGQIRSMGMLNLTANNNLEDIIPVGDRLYIRLGLHRV